MPSPLIPCPTCARHVRASESQCPFCATTITQHSVIERPIAPLRSRAAIAAFGASVALGACAPALQQQEVLVVQQQQQVVVQQQQVVVQQPDPVVIQQPQPVDQGSTVLVVRPPHPQPVVQPEPVVVPPPDHSGVVPAYGIAPYDPGSAVARYGAPPPPEDF